MKEDEIRLIVSGAFAGLSVYFGKLLIPLAILGGVILADYISGHTKAGKNKDISSQKGYEGIKKKTGYFLLVVVGGVIDWLLQSGLQVSGIDIKVNWTIAMLITIWLIINELISILENLYELGVSIPFKLDRLIKYLKVSVEKSVSEKLPETAKEEINDTDKKESGKFE